MIYKRASVLFLMFSLLFVTCPPLMAQTISQSPTSLGAESIAEGLSRRLGRILWVLGIVGQDQMFQMEMQNFPNMLRQMGANIDSETQMDVGGKSARVFSATTRAQMSGMSIRSINVFIQGANLWVQVMGPDQNPQQIQQVLQSILGGLQFQGFALRGLLFLD